MRKRAGTDGEGSLASKYGIFGEVMETLYYLKFLLTLILLIFLWFFQSTRLKFIGRIIFRSIIRSPSSRKSRVAMSSSSLVWLPWHGSKYNAQTSTMESVLVWPISTFSLLYSWSLFSVEGIGTVVVIHSFSDVFASDKLTVLGKT